MSKVHGISVVIVTKNRWQDLQHCLGSLAVQTVLPNELVVIDNNSSDATAQIVSDFSEKVKIAVRYFKTKKRGYPRLYNLGLEKTNYDWVAVIDDDCVASPDWLRELINTAKDRLGVAAVMGKSETYWKQNFSSQLTYFLDSFWKARAIRGSRVVDLEVLDNKNILYHKQWLDKKGITFDETRIGHGFMGASEDCDLGMQIQVSGGMAAYSKNSLISHKDPTSLSEFYKKLIRSSREHAQYEKKWQEKRSKLVKQSSLDKLAAFVAHYKRFTAEQAMGLFSTILLQLHLSLALVTIQLVKRYAKK